MASLENESNNASYVLNYRSVSLLKNVEFEFFN